MSRIVCKFGGTSVADANQIRKLQAIVAADPRRRVVVPSAPGKRSKDDPKVTDLLYLCHDMAAAKTDFATPFNQLRERYLRIERDLGVAAGMARELEQFHCQVQEGASRDFVASRGEHFNGLIIAAVLGAEFVDPEKHVVIDANGNVDPATYAALGQAMADPQKLYVMPGFYGRDHHGRVKTFSRGGSDISGAIAARAVMAELYENWTDVSGLLMADPRIVENPCHMDQVTYREIRELSYMGASVFHDEAILPVREARIPINIKNTNRPEDPGTLIVPTFTASKYKIAGIAGKRNFSMICLEKSLMNKEVGFGYKVLEVLFAHGVSFEHCPTSIDSMSIILENRQIEEKAEAILPELKAAVNPDKLELLGDLALIAVVGEEMANTPGMAALAFTALRDAKINVRIINQGASELNIIIGVKAADYETAVRALYHTFVKA
ncbi:MAG: aspartate kinase [Lentisphaeria bacterium]|jgi:aspartate kinase